MDKLERDYPEMSRFIDEEIEEWKFGEWNVPQDREGLLKRLKDHCVSSLHVRIEHLDMRIQQLGKYSPTSKQGKHRGELMDERLNLVYLSENLDNAFSKFGDDMFKRIQRSIVEESER